MSKNLWGGRFEKPLSSQVKEFGNSLSFDWQLYKEDIKGSIAHAKMLNKESIISEKDAKEIVFGLKEILKEIEDGNFNFNIEEEDIHMAVESALISKIGEVGKKLHTARSRNDQVALDLRLYVKRQICLINTENKKVLETLISIAQAHKETIMPGYTHLQHGQPILLGFHLMAYFQMFARDLMGFKEVFKTTDWLPLGCGAFAGTNYTTNRNFLAKELDFRNICENAMDAVSDRDFAIKFLSCCSIEMMHLSRFCEELIIWNSKEFDFIKMDQGYSTGSSIMPQKQNPDVAELIRGKTGRVYGNLMSLLTTMKGLPLAYNKDMQEDKETIFDSAETLISCLKVFKGMIESITFNQVSMASQAKKGFMNATDAADYLVKKGLPFRDSHRVIGEMVLFCEKSEIALEDLPLSEMKSFSTLFSEDIYGEISPKACINNKKSQGSTSLSSLEIIITKGKNFLTLDMNDKAD